MANREKPRRTLAGLFWELMDSMKFAVALLIIMTTVSVIGVLLPQYPPDGFAGSLEMLYLDKFGRVLGGLFIFLGLDRLFTVWWYYLLLALLCFNILVCSFNRLGGILRLVRRVHFLKEEKSYRDQANHRAARLDLDPQAAAARASVLLRKDGYRVFESAGEAAGVRLLYGRRGRFSPLGPFFTHIAMVLVILGAAISYLLSFEHFQWMAPGDTVRVPDMSYLATPAYQFELVRGRLRKAFGLPSAPSSLLELDSRVRDSDWRELDPALAAGALFSVQLDRFEAQFTPQGKPLAYLSTVTVLEGEGADRKPLFSHIIKVNDPLIQRGVYFYQSSYAPGGEGADWVELTFESTDSAAASHETHSLRLKPGGEALPLGESGDSVRVARFVGTFQMNAQGQVAASGGEDRNPAAEVQVIRDGQELMRVWVFKNFPNFSHRPGLPWAVVLKDYGKGYLTGLTIRTHRSQNVIWLGFLLMALGVTLSFYVNHREFWVLVRPEGDSGAHVSVAGLSYKWKQPFGAEFDRLAGTILSAPGDRAGAADKPAGTSPEGKG
ncbi:cytochrome c biogenesis protein ResB [bacterium]|nr:cytochrome c biogenesis protein ResB [bacterium]